MQAYPGLTWPHVPADKQIEFQDEVNKLLKEERIPEVDADIMRWRMAGCFRDLQRQGKRSARKALSCNR